MSRSILTTKYHLGVIGKFEKSFKENYKKENNEPFKGNVLVTITLGAIQKKRLPDVNDCITLIKLGNNNCDDTQAEDILNRWLDIEENKQRGLTGAFCELCKDLCLDVPLNIEFTKQLNGLEEQINNMQTAMNQMTELLSKFKDMVANTSEKKEELGVEEKDTQE